MEKTDPEIVTTEAFKVHPRDGTPVSPKIRSMERDISRLQAENAELQSLKKMRDYLIELKESFTNRHDEIKKEKARIAAKFEAEILELDIEVRALGMAEKLFEGGDTNDY